MGDDPRRCPAITRGGKPCKTVPEKDHVYCIWHDPERQQEAAQKRALGGYNSARDARARKLLAKGIESLGDLQDVLTVALLEVYAGKLDPRIANAMATLSGRIRDLTLSGEYETQITEIREAIASLVTDKDHAGADDLQTA